MTEFELINAIVRQLGGRSAAGVLLGSGDDAALLEGEAYPLVTVDTLVEGVHWDPALSRSADVGFKLLAANLSDIAAMGGRPGPFLVAMTLGGPDPVERALAYAAGIEAARRAHRLDAEVVVPIGGDLTRSPGVTVLSLTLLGRPVRPGHIWRRSGARVGDGLWVSGTLGAAAAGLAALRAWPDAPEGFSPLVERHRRPRARTELAERLADVEGIHACIDVSDGLAGDLGHILEASHLGARVEAARVPVDPGVDRVASRLGLDRWQLVLGGGDDYELLMAAAPEATAALERAGLSRIGVTVTGSETHWLGAGGARLEGNYAGHDHLAAEADAPKPGAD